MKTVVGKLSFIRRAGYNQHGHKLNQYRCYCGTLFITCQDYVNCGDTKSCGCYSEKVHTKHGHNRPGSKSLTYRTWDTMIQRCTNPNNTHYHNYGGRGIKIHPAWKKDFRAFLSDMGERPSVKYSIERIDNDGNYEPSNCTWATKKQQARNRRFNPKSLENLRYWRKQ